MNCRLKRGIILAAVAATTTPAWGLGIRIADQNAFATARGNAFAATADNPSAIYYNPAGITQLRGHNFLANGYGVTLESRYIAPDGTRTTTEDEIHFVPNFFYTYSLEDHPFSFGMGFYSPYGLGIEWPDNSTFRETRGEITYVTLNPTAAWRVNEALSIGAGLRFNGAEAELKQTVMPAFLFAPGGRNEFKGDGGDIGYNAGILWKPLEQHSFGLTYFSATRINLEGETVLSGFPPGPLVQSATARFQFPQHIIAGWSFRPTTNWNLEVNIDWTDWDSLDSVTVNQPISPSTLPFNWQSSFFYEFGVTRYFSNGLRVSGGYIFSENSVPDSSFNPIVPDSDRHVLSVGVGGNAGKFRWDAAYQYGYGPNRTVQGNSLVFPAPSSADGQYEFNSHALSLSLQYSF